MFWCWPWNALRPGSVSEQPQQSLATRATVFAMALISSAQEIRRAGLRVGL